MDIKEPNLGLVLDGLPRVNSPDKETDPPSITAKIEDSPAVTIEVSHEAAPQSELRERLNKTIAVINVASETTGQIEKLVRSLEGISQQLSVNQDNKKTEALKAEAEGIIKEIKRSALETSSEGVKPLAGDTIRLELEEELGRTLEIILPDGGKEAFGLSDLSFSQKDFIINTRAAVEKALQNIEALRESVDRGSQLVKEVVASFEVAFHNGESAKTSLRDVDKAIQLARDTTLGISKDPEGALDSVGKLPTKSSHLLE